MDKLNYTSLLLKRYKLVTIGYCRNKNTKSRFTLVLENRINKYVIDVDVDGKNMALYKLFNAMKLCSKLCQDKNYQITKCLTLQDWNNYIKFILLPENSLKSKYMIHIDMIKLKYNLSYQISSLTSTEYEQINCACFKPSDFLFRYPQNGELLRILIHFSNSEEKGKHIIEITIMDTAFISLGQITLRIKGKTIENTPLYLEWEKKLPQQHQQHVNAPYQNGILLIETFPNSHQQRVHKCNDKFSTCLKLGDWSDFDYDYVFKAY